MGTTLTASKAYYFGGAYETHSDGAIRKYYSLAGQTVAMRTIDTSHPAPGTLTYFLTDHLGSTLTVLDDQGAILSEQRYLPFGAVRDDAGTITQTDFGYTFQRNMPDTGLMDYKARFYSPYLNHFTQPDSIVPEPANPQSWNRYSYVGNSPINFSDPTGHMRIQDGDQRDRYSPSVASKYVPKPKPPIDNDGGDIGTVSNRAWQGDIDAIFDLITPTHFGWRSQFEGCENLTKFGFCLSIGGNIVYNRVSDRLIAYLDITLGTSVGEGFGGSVTTGPLVGWFMSNTKPLSSGLSATLNGTLANEGVVSVSVSAPIRQSRGSDFLDIQEIKGVYRDQIYGPTPLTYFIGGGVGGFYGGGGASLSGTVFSADATNLLPWNW